MRGNMGPCAAKACESAMPLRIFSSTSERTARSREEVARRLSIGSVDLYPAEIPFPHCLFGHRMNAARIARTVDESKADKPSRIALNETG